MHSRLALPALTVLLIGCSGPVTPSDGGSGMDGGADADVAPCTRDSECGDQSLFCTQWRCRPGTDGTDARGCIELGSPCDDGQGCDEERDQCGAAAWCTEGREGCLEPGDCDGDSHLHTLECGGDDCADDDADRYPGNPEICDEAHDEDCNPETVGMTDADSDGFVSSACCNGEQCGPDCDDSNANVRPDVEEMCNAIDDDCDGSIDEGSAFCPTGTCIHNRCRATGWEHVFLNGHGANSIVTGDRHPLRTDDAGNAYFWIKHGGAYPEIDIDGDGVAEAGGGYLVSVDPVGRIRWVQPADEPLEVVTTSAGGPLVSVDYSNLVWFDSSTGALQRTLPLESEAGWDASPFGAAAWYDGSFYVGQTLSHIGDMGFDDRTILLRRLDSDGAELDRRLIEIDVPPAWGADPIYDIAVSAAGVAVIGTTRSQVDLGMAATGAPVTVDGDFLAVFTHDLEPSWAVSGLPSFPVDVAISQSGRVAIVGWHPDVYPPPWGGADWAESEGYALMFENDGSYLWDWRFEGHLVSADFDGRSGLVTAGWFSGTFSSPVFTRAAEGLTDAVAVLFESADGLVLDVWHMGGAGRQAVVAVSGDAFGNFVMLGDFTQELDLPSGSAFTDMDRSGFQAWAIRVADAM